MSEFQKMYKILKLQNSKDVNDISLNILNGCLLKIPLAKWRQKLDYSLSFKEYPLYIL